MDMTDSVDNNAQGGRVYRVIQLGPPRNADGVQQITGVQRNEAVTDFDSLVTHHPGNNRHAHLVNGVPTDVEDQQPDYRGGNRSYAYVGNEIQEIIDYDTDGRYRTLELNQVLLVKDFILEDPDPPPNTSNRAVDVPSPVGGYVNQVRPGAGMVEIMDREGGRVLTRIRHMSEIAVEGGDTVVYGQALGTQNRLGLSANTGKHVHLEMDTGHYQQYENYMSDLISGRLRVQAENRENVAPLPVIDDGTFRVGETSPRVQDLQRMLVQEGILGVNRQVVETDGVYRLSMQPAVLLFQRTHGLAQTGDIDPATLQLVDHHEQNRRGASGPALGRHLGAPEPDRPDLHHQHQLNRNMERERDPDMPPAPNMGPPVRDRPDPRHPDHPDHAMNEGVRERIRSLYAEQGVTLAGQQLDNTTACVMRDARLSGMTEVTLMEFSEDPRTGQPKLDGNLIAYQGDPNHPASRWSGTNTQQAAATPEVDAYRQFGQATQQQTQVQAQYLAQQEQIAAQSRDRGGLSLG
ncbi:MAG TPA: XVIPCD domain-containing protein [Pseudoxanthomonas sp.]